MLVRLGAAKSLPLTEYPFRVNELGQSLHVRPRLGRRTGAVREVIRIHMALSCK